MNLYKVTRKGLPDYDQFIGFICAAENEHNARHMDPSGTDGSQFDFADEWKVWTKDSNEIKVELIGIGGYATERVIMSSFRHG